ALLGRPAPQELDFWPQPHTRPLEDNILCFSHQRVNVVCCCGPGIDDEVGVLFGNFGAADALALEPRLLDQSAGKIAVGIGEDTACAEDARLRAHALRVE